MVPTPAALAYSLVAHGFAVDDCLTAALNLCETGGALFGSGGVGSDYRYMLWRDWGDGDGYLAFLMLNPSTADHVRLDPTVAYCCRLAVRDGYRGIIVANLFAYRSTDPRVMRQAQEPVGDRNNAAIYAAVRAAKAFVCAWGNDGAYRQRADAVRSMLGDCGRPAFTLGLTKRGEPRHPLYQPNDAPLHPYVLTPAE